MKKHIIFAVLATIPLGLVAQTGDQDNQQKEFLIITALVEKNWNGTGVFMGKEATFTMDWQRVLRNQFLKLEFQNKRISEDGSDIVFMATAFYKMVNDSLVVGNWFDNRGVTFPLSGSIKENELTILWGNEETEMGKTIYSSATKNEIAVEDYIMNNGEYFKFGSATYHTQD